MDIPTYTFITGLQLQPPTVPLNYLRKYSIPCTASDEDLIVCFSSSKTSPNIHPPTPPPLNCNTSDTQTLVVIDIPVELHQSNDSQVDNSKSVPLRRWTPQDSTLVLNRLASKGSPGYNFHSQLLFGSKLRDSRLLLNLKVLGGNDVGVGIFHTCRCHRNYSRPFLDSSRSLMRLSDPQPI